MAVQGLLSTPELLLRILGHLPHQTIALCASVNRTWRETAETLIWTHNPVVLTNKNPLGPFLKVEKERRQYYADKVTKILIENVEFKKLRPPYAILRTVGQISFPSLQEITIEASQGVAGLPRPRFEEELYAKLARPPVKHLNIYRWPAPTAEESDLRLPSMSSVSISFAPLNTSRVPTGLKRPILTHQKLLCSGSLRHLRLAGDISCDYAKVFLRHCCRLSSLHLTLLPKKSRAGLGSMMGEIMKNSLLRDLQLSFEIDVQEPICMDDVPDRIDMYFENTFRHHPPPKFKLAILHNQALNASAAKKKLPLRSLELRYVRPKFVAGLLESIELTALVGFKVLLVMSALDWPDDRELSVSDMGLGRLAEMPNVAEFMFAMKWEKHPGAHRAVQLPAQLFVGSSRVDSFHLGTDLVGVKTSEGSEQDSWQAHRRLYKWLDMFQNFYDVTN